VKKPIAVRAYRHSEKHKFIVDLRAYGKGRMFFKTRAEADAECLRQKTLMEPHSREAIGLSQREMLDFIEAEFTSHAQGQAWIKLTGALGRTRSRFIEDVTPASGLARIRPHLKKIQASSIG
jgi:hypothetical protein